MNDSTETRDRDGLTRSVRMARPLSASDRKAYGIRGNHPASIAVSAGLWHPGGGATQRPRFSVTATITRRSFGRRDELAGGCMHDEVLRYFPKLAPIVALHLSDDDGTPMHAEANGMYWLLGYYGGVGAEYHGGNSKQNFPSTPPADQPWRNTEYRNPTPDECLAIFAEHIRATTDDARAIADRVAGCIGTEALRTIGEKYPDARQVRATLAELWRVECEAMRPRWAEEAAAGIALLDSLRYA